MYNEEHTFLQESDTIVTSVIEKYLERSKVGREKILIYFR